MLENKTIEPARENTSEVKASDLDQVKIPDLIKETLDKGFRIFAQGICCAVNTCYNDNKIDELCSKCPHSQENVIKLAKAGKYATYGTNFNDKDFKQVIEKIKKDYPLTPEQTLQAKVAELETELREIKRFPRVLIGCNVGDCFFNGEAGCTKESIVLEEDGSCESAEFVCDECGHKFPFTPTRVLDYRTSQVDVDDICGEAKSFCDSCFNEEDEYIRLRDEPYFQDY